MLKGNQLIFVVTMILREENVSEVNQEINYLRIFCPFAHHTPYYHFFNNTFPIQLSGSPLTDTDSWTEFLTTRTFSTMNIVEEPECNVLFSFFFNFSCFGI